MKNLYTQLERRILVLDGALGTMIQAHKPVEADYRGEEFADWATTLAGCNDLLCLTAPRIPQQVHEAYLDAGADIISTNTFNANRISLADYSLENYAYRINRAAAQLAREAADRHTAADPAKPRFVAGSVGPTNRTASIPLDILRPDSRGVTFDELAGAYCEQIEGLADGGVDIILVETIFDALNAKAALYAIDKVLRDKGIEIPIMVSGTLSDAGGRTLSGQTVEAFYTSLEHGPLLSVGLNCAFGARKLHPYLKRLAEVARCRISVHPNAGLPNISGGSDETPDMMAADVERFLADGLVNIVGGCCGTTPAHIAAIAAVAQRYTPRPVPAPRSVTALSGLERLEVTPERNFVNIGERANVAGSAKFARLVREGSWEEALGVATEQVGAGAQIVDVCMDDGMIDGREAMTRFLLMASAEPELARVPFMIDSSSWEVLEAGLKCVQGKGIVNSISLKEGEAEFLRRARAVRSYGAAMVVMLFDERGQADTFDRKVEVAKRSYDLLTGAGIEAENIIFDPNVLAVGTGIEAHARYGVDFIEACRWIKANLPGVRISGGVSNLSFAFRGNNRVREAMHAVFLYHAIAAGMDMGIVNASMLAVYDDIEPELAELVTDVIFARGDDAPERLARYAEGVSDKVQTATEVQEWRTRPLEARIQYAMAKGVTDFIAEDALEGYRVLGSPLAVIDGCLMPAMEEVGRLFGEGKMFLPQIIKSARVMKQAVGVLTPFMGGGADDGQYTAKILIATVKGDVHDIGKNIVSVVLSCNGYRIRDLGVMVDAEAIAAEAAAWGADAVGLSGLITPSLDELIRTVERLRDAGLTVPVIIGGATTSAMHTAVKIAPLYPGPVIHSRDASDNVRILAGVLGKERGAFVEALDASQEALRERFRTSQGARRLLSPDEARARRLVKTSGEVITPTHTGRTVFDDYPIAEVEPYIDWNYFFPAFGLKGRYPELLDSPEKGGEARRLLADAKALLQRIKDEKLLTLQGVAGVFPARADGDDLVIGRDGREVRLPQMRQRDAAGDVCLSLADYVLESDDYKDYIGAFAVTGGVGLAQLEDSFRDAGDDYNAILAKLLSDRLTEAFCEAVHHFLRRTAWGYQQRDNTPEEVLRGAYQGIRVAFGYPACPDHSQKRSVFTLLGVRETTAMTLTESDMIVPGESLCGLVFAHPGVRYFAVGPQE